MDMEMKLHISKEVSLPIDAATQTMAILARKRVGKTYTASVLAEEFIKSEVPIVVLDPTGAWWGLRSSADGKHEGFPVVIIGGAHADVPLEEHAGKIIADLVVDHPGYYVIDFSQIETDAAVRRFAQDFGARFYFRKEEKRFPIHLFIDEADVFCPQQPFADQKKLVHVYDVIVRRGGIRGIGVTMISQRPAVLNKNILTQCETLFVLQISGSQDVDAIEHWTRIHGEPEQRKEMLSTVASLKIGESWLWSPSWLQEFRRIHIRQRETFNSSATPKAGEKVIVPQKLAPVDIAKLGNQIREAAERVKENDPAELKKEIARLHRENEQLARMVPDVEVREVSVITDEDREFLSSKLSQVNNLGEQIMEFINGLGEVMDECQIVLGRLKTPKQSHNKAIVMPDKLVTWDGSDRAVTVAMESNGKLEAFGKAEREILTVLGSYRQASKKKIAVCAGYAVSGGSFNNALGKLRSLGLITRGDPIQLTAEGAKAAPSIGIPTGDSLYHMWMQHPNLGKAERMILTALYQNRLPLDKETLAERTQYEASGGSFNNALGRLRTLELINRGSPIGLAEEFYS